MTPPPPPSFVEGLGAFGADLGDREVLHVGRPNIPDREVVLDRIGAALDRRWLSNDGPAVAEFEAAVAARLDVGHCIAVCSATQGLSVAAIAMGLKGEVLVPAFTFVATAHALSWLGLQPVFCDIDRDTHQLDPVVAAASITERTSAILGVHTWGRPSDVDALVDLAHRHDLDLFFDAAPAFGASLRGTSLGNFGRAEVVSFHATKIVTSGEGGAILTNDDDLAVRARMIRTFGFVDNDRVESLGTNAKMSELGAALGLSSLERYPEFRAAAERNFRRYETGLAGVPGVHLVQHPDDTEINFHNVVVEVDPHEADVDRDLVLRILTADRVLARRYFWPGCHRMEPYRTQRPPTDQEFPVTDLVAQRVLSLPTGSSIAVGDVDRVCALVAGIVEHGAEIRARDEREGHG